MPHWKGTAIHNQTSSRARSATRPERTAWTRCRSRDRPARRAPLLAAHRAVSAKASKLPDRGASLGRAPGARAPTATCPPSCTTRRSTRRCWSCAAGAGSGDRRDALRRARRGARRVAAPRPRRLVPEPGAVALSRSPRPPSPSAASRPLPASRSRVSSRTASAASSAPCCSSRSAPAATRASCAPRSSSARASTRATARPAWPSCAWRSAGQMAGRVCDDHLTAVTLAATGDRSAGDDLATGRDRCRSCARESGLMRRVLHERLAMAPWPLAIKPAGILSPPSLVASTAVVTGSKTAGTGTLLTTVPARRVRPRCSPRSSPPASSPPGRSPRPASATRTPSARSPHRRPPR